MYGKQSIRHVYLHSDFTWILMQYPHKRILHNNLYGAEPNVRRSFSGNVDSIEKYSNNKKECLIYCIPSFLRSKKKNTTNLGQDARCIEENNNNNKRTASVILSTTVEN